MSASLGVVLVLLASAIVMFAINKPRLDAVALIMLVALPFTGVLTVNEALSGFSDPNIVLIAALFVIGDGLVRTGVVQRLGDWLVVKAGNNEVRLMVLLMAVVCGLGATMSSTAVTAIFIPVALRISRATGIGPGRLMMPISAAALISGMVTLVATAMTIGLTWSTGFSRFFYFDKIARMNVIDIAVNRNMLCDQRMLANTTHVMNDARRLIRNSVPFYKFA